MASLGPEYGDDPSTCSDHCEVVFGKSLAETASEARALSLEDASQKPPRTPLVEEHT